VADLAELYLVLKAKADPLIKSINDLKRELPKQMAEAGKAGGEALEAEAKNAGDDAGKALGSGLKKGAKKGMDDAQKEVANARQRFRGEALSIGQSVGQSLTLGVSVPVSLGLKKAFEAAVNRETLEKGMKAIMGSAKAATLELANLEKSARAPGLGFTQATKASMQLQSLGLSASEARKQIEAVANANALVGGSADNFGEVMRQLAQVQSLGKVTAENINVIAERLPGFTTAIKRAFGTSNTEVIAKAMADGKLSMKQFIDGVVFELNRTKAEGDSMRNVLDNIADDMDKSLGKFGKAMFPDIAKGLKILSGELEKFSLRWKAMTDDQKVGQVRLIAWTMAIGPAVLGLTRLASGMKAIVDLTVAFKAAQLAQQEALSKTAGAAVVTRGALDGLLGSVNVLRASSLVPIVFTAVIGWNIGSQVKGWMDDQAKGAGFDNAGEMFNDPFGVLGEGKMGRFSERQKVISDAAKPNPSFMERWNRGRSKGLIGSLLRQAGVQSSRSSTSQTKDKDETEEKANPFGVNLSGQGNTGKGGGGRKNDPIAELINAGQSSLDRQESEKRIKAFMDAGNWTAAAFEQAGGKFSSQWGRITAAKRKIFEKLGEGLKSEFVAEQKQKAAAAKQMEEDLLREIREVNNPASMVDKLAREKFGKDFSKLTDPKNRSLITQLAGEYEKKESSEKDAERSARLAREEEDRMNRRNRWILGRNDAVKSMVTSLDAQLRKERELSTFEQMVAEAKEKGIRLNFFEIAVLKQRATQVDALKKSEKEQAENEKAAQIRREQIRDANEQYADALEEIATQAAELGRSGVLTEFRLKRLAITFGYGATESERLATGMERAKRVMREQLLLQDVKVWRDAFERVADAIVEPIRDALGELVTVDMPGFFRSLNTLVGRALTEFTNQILQAQIRLQLNRAIDWGVGQLFGGQLAGLTASGSSGSFMPPGVSLSPDGSQSMLTGFANGGGVGANSPIVVGERGPEIFVPSRSGNIVPNHRAGVGGQVVNITVNVQGSATRETAQ
jgi:tape measure domain-containing protein